MDDYTPSNKFLEALKKANEQIENKEKEREEEISMLHVLWGYFCDQCMYLDECSACRYKPIVDRMEKRIKEDLF